MNLDQLQPLVEEGIFPEMGTCALDRQIAEQTFLVALSLAVPQVLQINVRKIAVVLQRVLRTEPFLMDTQVFIAPIGLLREDTVKKGICIKKGSSTAVEGIQLWFDTHPSNIQERALLVRKVRRG